MSQPNKVGGARPGAGRKPIDPALKRSERVLFYVTAAELEVLESSDWRTWIRSHVVKRAEKLARRAS